MLGSNILANNSIISMKELFVEGNSTAQLLCVTENVMCCLNQTTNLESGWKWKFPNGTIIPDENTSTIFDNEIYVTNEFQALTINIFNQKYPPNGIYHCVVPDGKNSNTNLYIGIYNSSSAAGKRI